MNTIDGRDSKQILWSMLFDLYGVPEFRSDLLVRRFASAAVDDDGTFSLRTNEEFLVFVTWFGMTCSFSCGSRSVLSLFCVATFDAVTWNTDSGTSFRKFSDGWHMSKEPPSVKQNCIQQWTIISSRTRDIPSHVELFRRRKITFEFCPDMLSLLPCMYFDVML